MALPSDEYIEMVYETAGTFPKVMIFRLRQEGVRELWIRTLKLKRRESGISCGLVQMVQFQ
jgi:hypothetical protein